MAILTQQSLQRIERETKKYPPGQRQSAVMSALAIAQDQEGWLSSEVMEEVANPLLVGAQEGVDLLNARHMDAGGIDQRE